MSFRRTCTRNLVVAYMEATRRDPSCKFLGMTLLGMTLVCAAVAVISGKTVR
jgi:hypothetical protein